MGATASAQSSAQELELSLVKDKITLGEPILLAYKITNAAKEDKIAYFGQRGKDWLILEMKDEQGQPAAAVPDPRPISSSGQDTVASRVFPQRPLVGQFVVSQWLAISHPGAYRLRVRSRLPLPPASQTLGRPLTEAERNAKTTITDEFTFDLHISEPDPERLRAMAESLRKAALKPSPGSNNKESVEALFSMPAQYASSSWAGLARDLKPDNILHRFLEREMLDQLERLNSREAVDTLGKILWRYNRPHARTTLYYVHLRADAPLRRYIERLFASHQSKVPTEVFADQG